MTTATTTDRDTTPVTAGPDGRPAATDPRRPRRRAVDAGAVALVLAELGLLCAGLGTAAGFSRLFVGTGHLVSLGIAVGGGWAVSVLTRRLRLGVGVSALISVLAAVLFLTWWFAPHTTWFAIPTADTVRTVLDEMRRSFANFSALVAPVPATDGFLVVLAAALWGFTGFADTAAFRYRGPVQAVIPYTSAFVAAGILSRDVGRVGAAVVFVGGLGIYAVTQRLLVVSERRWVDDDAGRGTAAVGAAAAVVLAVAVVAGLVVGPRLPGGTDAVVDLRSLGRGAGPRTVVSPFVGVRNLLGAQSDQVVFRVQASRPTYWRLTSLGQYDPDRDIWVSSATYRDVHGSRLGPDPVNAPSSTSRQRFSIDGLAGPWLPAAYAPTRIDVDTDVSFDPDSSSIITRGSDLEPGTSYDVSSQVPLVGEPDLTGSRSADPTNRADLDVTGVSSRVAETARRVTADQPTSYLKALALQNWLRDSFSYDTGVDYSQEHDPVAAFLETRRGFCQQFSSTFALMARSIGLPARVAVGFTPGDLVAASDGESTYVVRGRHAHAWPEVHFDGVGWVPFEPTPGRGNPDAVAYTGIPAEQADPPPQQAPTTIEAPATSTPGPGSIPPATPTTANGTTTSSTQVGSQPGRGTERDADGGPSPWALLGSAAAVALVVAVAVRRRRRRIEESGHTSGSRVATTWRQVAADLAGIGLGPRASETPNELARRVAASTIWLSVGDGPQRRTDTPTVEAIASAIGDLASIETARRYAPRDVDELDARRSVEAAVVLGAAVRAVRGSRRVPVPVG